MTFFLLGAYATGVAMVHFTAPWPWSVYCALAISLVICWLILQPRPSAWLPCFGLLFLCGLVNTFLHMNPPAGQNHVAHFTDHQEYAIAGTLLSVEQREPEGYRLFVDVHLVAYQQREAQVSGNFLLYI